MTVNETAPGRIRIDFDPEELEILASSAPNRPLPELIENHLEGLLRQFREHAERTILERIAEKLRAAGFAKKRDIERLLDEGAGRSER